MIRGTTPTHKFKTDADISGAEVVYITYKQDGRTIFEKEKSDISFGENELSIKLTQDETLLLNGGNTLIQIRARFSDGTAVASNIMRICTNDILKDGVI